MDCSLLHPWDSPGKNTGVGCHFLLWGIFLTQGSNWSLLHCRWVLYHLSHQGSPPTSKADVETDSGKCPFVKTYLPILQLNGRFSNFSAGIYMYPSCIWHGWFPLIIPTSRYFCLLIQLFVYLATFSSFPHLSISLIKLLTSSQERYDWIMSKN